jgi:hypothetical protein
MLLVAFLAPATACAFPGARMSEAEHACCKHMNGECGSMKMPASHGCCQKNVEASHLDTVQPSSSYRPAISLSAAILPQYRPLVALTVSLQPIARAEQSPPGISPPAISVLRI